MYDARPKAAFQGNDILFPVALIGVILATFAAAWFFLGAQPSSGSAAPQLPRLAAADTNTPAIAAHMQSPDEQRFLAALAELNPDSVAELERTLSRDSLSREREIEAIMRAGGQAVIANVDSLRHVSGRDINMMIDTAITQLQSAQRADSPLCQGATLERLSTQSPTQVQRWMTQNGLGASEMYTVTMAFQADFMEMIVRARRNPTRHGPLTPRDEAAFQSFAMSLMSDPQIMRAMMASDQRQAVANMDVCAVSVSVLRQLRQLDDGLKGRAWSAAFSMPEFEQAMSQARAFGF